MRWSRLPARAYARVRAWPLWELPRWLSAFICATAAVYAAGLAVATHFSRFTGHDVLVLAALLGCLAATVELTRRQGDSSGLSIDVLGIWTLPVAILCPPVCAMLAPALQHSLVQWRVRRFAPHKQVFNTATMGLSYGAAAGVFHALPHGSGPAAAPLPWLGAVLAASVAQWAVNTGLVGVAVTGSDPGTTWGQVMFTASVLRTDASQFATSALVTASATITPLIIVLAFPVVTVMQRLARHEQLASTARLDHKTGLLNAGTWEREAAIEVARAVRTRTAMAVAIVDLDHFKQVNDTWGHLAGDKALRQVADALRELVRDYDLVGRFGGEEFAVLLPNATPVAAYAIAERMRAKVASLAIDVGPTPDLETVHITASVGVAAFGTSWNIRAGGALTDFIAAADMAVYQAKAEGRDQVAVITENTTFGSDEALNMKPRGSAASPPPAGPGR